MFDHLVSFDDIRHKKVSNVYKVEPGPNGLHIWYKYNGRDCDRFLRYYTVDNIRVIQEV